MVREVDVSDPGVKLDELVRWVASDHDRVLLRQDGRVVAEIIASEAATHGADQPAKGADQEDWLPSWAGLLVDHPEVADSIDEVYRDRQRHWPPPLLPIFTDGDEDGGERQ